MTPSPTWTHALEATRIPGCHLLHPHVHRDARGSFVKSVHAPTFEANGLTWAYREIFWSRSHRGVVRGLHLQLPPHDHDKLVFCVHGRVLDVVLDVRRGSPTYGEHVAVELDADAATAIYMPRGTAHGFAALSDDATLAILIDRAYAPTHDTGIRWDSAGVAWPFAAPLVSERDAAMVALSDFDSPFVYGGA